ncbi:MAG TPA: type II secretion system protein [Rhizobacter sp.]|nr:type II secretion system protein [Rhizobacter sp.]
MATLQPRRAQGVSAGFTLVELLITVVILALLAGGAMSFADLAVKRTQEQELRTALRQIRDAIDAYKAAADANRIRKAADESGYPPSLSTLSEGVADPSSLKGKKLYFLRRLPRDPLADPALPAEATWGLRSYDSDASDPQPGRDVFDVYSLSPRVSLGGRPYREW